ncbi:MAG: hypothetical protein IT442_03220 [Phycisphaeraceae bacterium]|nr:hypothetical protein [Phycisphaeraceae bacterium]
MEPDVTFPAEDSRCEGCGYALRGLDISGSCPECGLAIAESSPAKRTGLPWQHKRTLKNWLLTNWMVLTRPRQAFRVMQLESGIEEGLTSLQCLALSIVGSIGFVYMATSTDHRGRPVAIEFIFDVGPVPFVGVFLFLMAMTSLEAAGIWWFSRLKKTPLSWARVSQVCAYATVGWFWFPMFWVLAVVVWEWVGHSNRLLASVASTVWFNLLLIGGSAMWFESLVWIGIGQVRFGNADHSSAKLLPDSPRCRSGEKP